MEFLVNNKQMDLVVLKKSLQLRPSFGHLHFQVLFPNNPKTPSHPFLETAKVSIIASVANQCMAPPGMSDSQLQIAIAQLISNYQLSGVSAP